MPPIVKLLWPLFTLISTSWAYFDTFSVTGLIESFDGIVCFQSDNGKNVCQYSDLYLVVEFSRPIYVAAGFQFVDRQFRRHRLYVCKEPAGVTIGLINCRDDASEAPVDANLVPNPV